MSITTAPATGEIIPTASVTSGPVTFDLLTENPVYKPFRYPWAYEAWLVQQRVHWLPEEVPMADDVKDWHKNITAGERNLLTQIFRFFTQADCFPAGAEILTPRGWVDFSDLGEQDLVGQVHEDGRIEFVLPSHVIAKPFSGELVHISCERKAIDLLVTPSHNITYEWKGEWRREPAQSVNLYQNKRLRVAGYCMGEKNYLTPLERLAIAFQADGNTKKDCDGSKIGGIRHYFGFSKSRKIERLRGILEDICLPYEEWQEVRDTGVYTMFSVILPERMDKDFKWINLSNVSTSWCKEFIEEVSEWDSYRDAAELIYYTNTIKAASDKVHAVSIMAGIEATTYHRTDDRSEKFSDTFKVSIGRKDMLDCQYVEKKQVAYDGMVYCVTVPTGNIMVRWNGRSVVTGNCEVNNCYMKHYSQVFKPTEILMMLSAFSNIETVHIAAYSHLLDTVGMPETEYSAFMKYKEMKDKYDYMQNFNVRSKHEIAKTLAVFGAFTEGLQLFASFAILLNFPRFNKMKGMGQIISWSVRDESLHCLSIIRLFRTFISENPEIWTEALRTELYQSCATIVDHEDAFIDLAFEFGAIEGLEAADVKQYIRFIADRRLQQLGLNALYLVEKNPLPWLDEMLNAVEHANFFENRSTEYSKASTTGSWEEAFSDFVFTTPQPAALGQSGVELEGYAP